MPLIHGYGRKAVGENIKKEMSSGRPQRQSIAIALQEARDAKKRHNMWLGGHVDPDEQSDDVKDELFMTKDTSGEPGKEEHDEEEEGFQHLANGGEVGEEGDDVTPDSGDEPPRETRKQQAIRGFKEAFMHAGGEAEVPEVRHEEEEDSAFDEKYVENMLRRRRQRMMSGGYCR